MAEIQGNRPIKILLAEDELSVQKMIRKRLETNGFEVVLANDGEEVLRLAHETHPDMIVMDIIMPKMEGDNVANYLQQNEDTSRIPVIFMTCLVRPEEARRTNYVIGKNIILPKPIDSNQLLSLIKKTLDR